MKPVTIKTPERTSWRVTED